MRVVFILNKYGDLGNRLFRFARLYHKASKLGIKLIDLSFYQYVWYFKPENKFYRFIFFIQKVFGAKIQTALQKFSSDDNTLLNSYIAKIQIPPRAHINEVGGILAKNITPFSFLECGEIHLEGAELDEDDRLKLQKIFSIHPRYLKIAREILGPDRNLYTFFGVHIRHGDYREYGDGAFFLETQKYIEAIRELKKIYKGGKKLRFAIVCNEKLDRNIFDGLDVVFGVSDNPIIDLEILHNCDYIISTFSSYSAWPSLVNKIPRVIIEPNSSISFEKMHISNLNFWEVNNAIK